MIFYTTEYTSTREILRKHESLPYASFFLISKCSRILQIAQWTVYESTIQSFSIEIYTITKSTRAL